MSSSNWVGEPDQSETRFGVVHCTRRARSGFMQLNKVPLSTYYCSCLSTLYHRMKGLDSEQHLWSGPEFSHRLGNYSFPCYLLTKCKRRFQKPQSRYPPTKKLNFAVSILSYQLRREIFKVISCATTLSVCLVHSYKSRKSH